MGPYYLGIDPGVSGGVAVIDAAGDWVAVNAMPRDDEGIWTLISSQPLQGGKPHVFAALEFVRSSRQMGVVSAFTFGRSYGALRMALTGAGIPYREVMPKAWQAFVGVQYPKAAKGERIKRDKNITKNCAIDLFGRTRKITHATADALLIALYARHLWREKD